MTVLSRKTIEQLCRKFGMVYRLDDVALKIEPVSIDLHLEKVEFDSGIQRLHVDLPPGVFCLGSTKELFKMPDFVVGFVVGKSTIAREGLQIEAAGLIDPGFEGNITLELKNLHHRESYSLAAGDQIGQAYFMLTDQPVEIPYGPANGNHYQGQRGVTRSYRK